MASFAAGTHGVRQLPLSIPVVFRRQLAPDQSGGPDCGRSVAGGRGRLCFLLRKRPSITTPSSDSNAGCWKRPGASFDAGAGRDLKIAFEQFRTDQAHWLDDYALFRALKSKYRGVSTSSGRPSWFDGTRLPWPVPGENCRAKSIRLAWHSSSCFAKGRRLRNMPTPRSAVDRRPALFRFPRLERRVGQPGDFPAGRTTPAAIRRRRPARLFQLQGQLWGNPVYDWEAFERTGYRWCIDRMRALLAHVDLIRLDHFRGFAAAWHIPAGAPTAQSGQWVPGPGAEFFQRGPERTWALCRSLRRTWDSSRRTCICTPRPIPRAREHESCSSLSMAVPTTRTCPTTTFPIPSCTPGRMTTTRRAAGTKRCPMTSGRSQAVPGDPRVESAAVTEALLQLAWSSAAGLALAPLQDLLNLGAEARMNVPGRAKGIGSGARRRRCFPQRRSIGCEI